MSRQKTFTLRIVYAVAAFITGTMALYARQEVTPDSPLTITLDGSGPVDLVYRVDAAATVAVVARSLEAPGVIDTTLQVIGPDGLRVAGGFNDDHHTARAELDARDSVIENLELSPGWYILRVDSFNGVSKGRVEVRVETVDMFQAVVAQDDAGWVVTARLPAGRHYPFSFEAAEGDRVTLTARDLSGTLDPLLILRAADERVLARNDDHAPGDDAGLDVFDARIAGFAIPAGGIYTVEVFDFFGFTGRFELSIRREQGRE